MTDYVHCIYYRQCAIDKKIFFDFTSCASTPGGYSHIVWVLDQIFANFVTLYQTKNAQLFLISVFCELSR